VLGKQRAQQSRLVAVEQPAARRALRPSTIDMMTPCRVRIVLLGGLIRVTMLRRLICMWRACRRRKNSTFSKFAFEHREEGVKLLLADRR